MTQELPANIQAIIDKVEKLLRLASNNDNEHQAAAAAAKAQELLAAHNLDMVLVQQAGGKTDKREDKRMAGGLYKWQRELWNDVANLNFCKYWYIRGLKKGSKYEHRLVGRTVNIVSTRLMAEYLEQAIERITRERFENNSSRYFSRDGIAFREGMADRIGARLRQRRHEAEIEAVKKQEEEKKRQPNTANALTIVDVRKSEAKANEEFEYDLRHGPGAWVRVQAEHTKRMDEIERESKIATERFEAWKIEHPEEWAAQQAADAKAEEKERKRRERNERRRTSGGGNFKGWSPRSDTYYEGRDRGDDVSLDKQVAERSNTTKLGIRS